jgi:hypothetical protein
MIKNARLQIALKIKQKNIKAKNTLTIKSRIRRSTDNITGQHGCSKRSRTLAVAGVVITPPKA